MSTVNAPSLEAVSAALVDASTAISHDHGDAEIHAALVAMARASYDALAIWEGQLPVTLPPPSIIDRVITWRGQIDELRVQAALAEMELRDSSHDALAATERSVVSVERALAAASREVGTAVSALRSNLKKAMTQ